MELATDHEFSLDDWKQLPDMQRGFHITAPFHRCKSRSQERATNHNAARNKTAVYPLCLSGEVAIGGFRISWGPASSSEAERTQSEFERGYRTVLRSRDQPHVMPSLTAAFCRVSAVISLVHVHLLCPSVSVTTVLLVYP